jgi:hypothetical protein
VQPLQCDGGLPPDAVEPPELSYWRHVPGDEHYLSEYTSLGPEKYVVFEPDCGGWNNVRMAFETVVLFAAMTGRTLVMAPRKMPIYLLDKNPEYFENAKGIHALYSMSELASRMSVVSFEEFIEREVKPGNLGHLPDDMDDDFFNAKMGCGKVPFFKWLESGQARDVIWSQWEVFATALIFPSQPGGSVKEEAQNKPWLAQMIKTLTAAQDGRKLVEYTKEMQEVLVMHFSGDYGRGRMLTHPYAWIAHADRSRDDFSKRFVRDALHYHSGIYCKARDVISLILADAGSGGFSTMHVRRGDLQFTEVKISAEKLLQGVENHLLPGETLYIATDEADKSFFAPFHDAGYKVKMLQDYYTRAGLAHINQNYVGMIESIVAAHGRTFTGTYKSSFTGYIYRLRLYYGKPSDSNWHHTPGMEKVLHDVETDMSDTPIWSREWPLCCRNIDGTRVPRANGLQARRYQWGTHEAHDNVKNVAAKHGVTIYSKESCDGGKSTFGLDYEEKRCSGCWDSCGKKFDDGQSTHDARGSQVRSLEVTGQLRVTVADGSCHGGFNYGNKDLKKWPSFTEKDGCVSLISNGNPPAHLVVEELNAVAGKNPPAHLVVEEPKAVAAKHGVTVYSTESCDGSTSSFAIDYIEKRCIGCWDTCDKSFDDGSAAHDVKGSQVRSLQVTGPLRVLVGDGHCHGTYVYDSKDMTQWPVFTEKDGCVNLISNRNPPAHLVVEELNPASKIDPCDVFDVEVGDVLELDDVDHLDAESQSVCCAACTREATCGTFVFSLGRQHCWLKATGGQRAAGSEDSGIVAGFKRSV